MQGEQKINRFGCDITKLNLALLAFHATKPVYRLGCGRGRHSVYLQSQARSTGSLCSKDPYSLLVFREEILKANLQLGLQVM